MKLLKANISLSGFFKPRKSGSDPAQFGRDARADWQVVCISFLVLTLIAITVSVAVYERINKGEIFFSGKKAPVSLRTLNRFELENTILFFEKKHERFEALRRRPLSTVDPFIPKPASKKE